MRKAFPAIFLKISSLLYVALITNVLLLIACAPWTIVVIFTDWKISWLGIAVLSVLITPALQAAFAVFADYTNSGMASPVKAFVIGWLRAWRRGWPLAIAVPATAVVIGVDVYFFMGTSLGLFTIPALVLLTLIGLVAYPVAGLLLSEQSAMGKGRAVVNALFSSVRCSGWSLISLAVGAVFVGMFYEQPALTLVLAPSPALFVIWSNSRRVLERHGWLSTPLIESETTVLARQSAR
jgi:hypothetical protein